MHPYLAELLIREHQRKIQAETQRKLLIDAGRARRHLLTTCAREWLSRAAKHPCWAEVRAAQ